MSDKKCSLCGSCRVTKPDGGFGACSFIDCLDPLFDCRAERAAAPLSAPVKVEFTPRMGKLLDNLVKEKAEVASSPSPTITVINLAEAKELWDSATRYLGHTKGEWVKVTPRHVSVPIPTLLEIRDALAREDIPEAYYLLYGIADPTYTSRNPWKQWELPSPPEENRDE